MRVHIYMFGNTQSALTTARLNGCLRNLVGIKNPWFRTCVKVFQLDPPRGRSKAWQNLVTGSSFSKRFFFRPEGYSKKKYECKAMI